MSTPWKSNIAPEKSPSQKERTFSNLAFFRGYVKLGGCIIYVSNEKKWLFAVYRVLYYPVMWVIIYKGSLLNNQYNEMERQKGSKIVAHLT